MKERFLNFLQREIESTCRMKRADAEKGLLCFSAVRSSMAFLFGELAAAGVLGIITDSEWDEFNEALTVIEKELYDMVR